MSIPDESAFAGAVSGLLGSVTFGMSDEPLLVLVDEEPEKPLLVDVDEEDDEDEAFPTSFVG